MGTGASAQVTSASAEDIQSFAAGLSDDQRERVIKALGGGEADAAPEKAPDTKHATFEDCITLNVSSASGNVMCITASLHDKVSVIKRRLTIAMGVPRFRLQLACEGHLLDDNVCLSHYWKPTVDPVSASVVVLPVPDCQDFWQEDQVEEFEQAFSAFSGTSHGTITAVQLGVMLHSLGQVPMKRELQDLLLDFPGSAIEFSDFLAWMARNLAAMLNDIPELHERVKKQMATLEVGDFSDVSKMDAKGRASVLKILEEIGDQVKAIFKDSMRFNRYEALLESDMTLFEDVEDLKTTFNMTLKLWQGLDSWENCMDEWSQSAYRVEEIQLIQSHEIPKFFKTALQSSKCFPGNNVVQIWRSAIIRVKGAFAVILALKNKALKPEHWELISSLIGLAPISGEQELTLGSVLEWKADSRVEKMLEISEMATVGSASESPS